MIGENACLNYSYENLGPYCECFDLESCFDYFLYLKRLETNANLKPLRYTLALVEQALVYLPGLSNEILVTSVQKHLFRRARHEDNEIVFSYDDYCVFAHFARALEFFNRALLIEGSTLKNEYMR